MNEELARWVSCPECGSSDVKIHSSIPNDWIRITCDDCGADSLDATVEDVDFGPTTRFEE